MNGIWLDSFIVLSFRLLSINKFLTWLSMDFVIIVPNLEACAAVIWNPVIPDFLIKSPTGGVLNLYELRHRASDIHFDQNFSIGYSLNPCCTIICINWGTKTATI